MQITDLPCTSIRANQCMQSYVKPAALQCMLLHFGTLSAVICIHPSESDIYHHPIQLHKYNEIHSLNPGRKCTTCTINSVISTPHQKVFQLHSQSKCHYSDKGWNCIHQSPSHIGPQSILVHNHTGSHSPYPGT